MVPARWLPLWLGLAGATRLTGEEAEVAAATWGDPLCDVLKVKDVPRSFFDDHSPSVMCSLAGAADCTAQRFQIIAPEVLKRGQKTSGPCSEYIRSPPFVVSLGFSGTADVWETVGVPGVLGEVTLQCQDVRGSRRPLFVIVEHTCRQLYPFSVLLLHRPLFMNEPNASMKFPWQVEACTEDCAWSTRELKIYQCEQVPAKVVLKTFRFKHGALPMDTAIKKATEACAKAENCTSVAVDAAGGKFQLLSQFACGYAPRFADGHWPVGKQVRYAGWPDFAPSKSVGTVSREWNLDSKSKLVRVTFPDAGDIAMHVSSLSPADAHGAWTVVHNLRPRNIICKSLQPGYSCDVQALEDAKELDIESESPEACQELCRKQAVLSRFSLAERGCCVFVNGVCSIMQGEWFKIPFYMGRQSFPDNAWDAAEVGVMPFEAAGECYELPCASDPTCAFDSSFGATPPPDAPVDGGDVVLYYDFAHPLLAPFFEVPEAKHPAIFHFTSADAAAEKLISDSVRMVRAVGSVPASAPREGWTPSVLGFNPQSSRDAPKMLRNVTARLRSVCHNHGIRLGRHLKAPRLTANVWEECYRMHRSTSTPAFEPCLMQRGCALLGRGAGYFPFHAPWFSKLPFDILAWQQPVPFCCAIPYNHDLREEFRMHEFFKNIDFQDPDKVDLSGVPDADVKANMEENLKEGGMAIKKLLAHDSMDEAGLEWLGGFILAARDAMSNSFKDFMDAVGAEGGSEDDDEPADEPELSPDGLSFLHVHTDGDHETASGLRAFRVAEWSHSERAFVQLGPGPKTNNTFWSIVKQVPGAIFNYGIKPLWRYVLQPLVRWGVSITKWVIEHPRTALFISKLALAIRDRLCEKASYMIYETPETRTIGLFAKSSETLGALGDYLKDTFSPAVLLVGLKEALQNSQFAETMKSLASAAFGLVLSFAGVATGGAVLTIVGNLVSFLADASLDAGKQALEFMIYKEIAKEIPSNLYDFLLKKCLFKRQPQTKVTLGATGKEVAGAAAKTLEEVTRQVRLKTTALTGSMSRFAEFFDESHKGKNLTEVLSGVE